jgi:hypothetical protein
MPDRIATIRYLTTTSFGFGASALLADVLAELSIARPFVVTDPGVRAAGIADEVAAAACEPGRATWFDRSPPNPTEAAVLEGTEAFRAASRRSSIRPRTRSRSTASSALHAGSRRPPRTGAASRRDGT